MPAEQGQGTGNYEAAPGTALVDQRCVACGRALLDAASLAAGMGPDCREKYGVSEEITAEQRAQANRAIYALASNSHGGQDAAEHLATLRAIGFTDLCDRIEARRVKVTIHAYRLCEGAPEVLRIDFPGADPSKWATARRTVPGLLTREESIAGVKATFSFVALKGDALRALLAALSRCLPGALGRGRHGLFVLPSEPSTKTGQRAA